MADKQKRSAMYGDIADILTRTCMASIDERGHSAVQPTHGSPSVGHLAYCTGELYRCRPDLDLTDIQGRNLIEALQYMIENELDLDNEIHRCFVAMGLGLVGKADGSHVVLNGVSDRQRRSLYDGLIVTKEFDNNWEAFNGSILIGRHMLYGDSADAVLGHFEKIAAKYDQTGYFDDTNGLGNYNNYGLMSLNYPLRAGEYLDKGHPVRMAIENRFKEHALRYIELIRTFVSPRGDVWPFGRSAGVLGQLQCIVLIEQCLSNNWIDSSHVDHVRSIAREAMKRMLDLYWDGSMRWFNFRDEYQTGYDYRASLPMAWDMLRYFLQIERYASMDERFGTEERDVPVHSGPCHREVVTNPDLKTAVYVWSDGTDHAVLPIMGGPHHITGDTIARPYAQGLFEWTTQHAVPALCPRVTIDGTAYWPSWHAENTELTEEGEKRCYRVRFDRLRSDNGTLCPVDIGCETTFVFSSGAFERVDVWEVGTKLMVDEYALEVLQPSPHPHRPNAGDVYPLNVSWTSEINSLRLSDKIDVSGNPVYRNYHSHSCWSWRITAGPMQLETGRYETRLGISW